MIEQESMHGSWRDRGVAVVADRGGGAAPSWHQRRAPSAAPSARPGTVHTSGSRTRAASATAGVRP